MSSDFLDKDIVYVSSNDRYSGNSNDFVINLTDRIKSPNDYDTLTLLNFTCPKSYYLFNNINNKFYVNENGNISTITITNGNYDFTSLANELNTKLAGCLWTYAVSTNIVTGKFTFSVTNNGGIQPIFDFSGNSPYRIIGFDKAIYPFVTNSLTSVNIVNLQLTNTIKICCSIISKGTLATIIPNISDFSTITYSEQNPNFSSHGILTSNLGSVRIWLLDAISGNPLDLNGLDWFFSFAIYKKNNYYKHMIEDMQMQAKIADLNEKLRLLEESRLKNDQ